MRENSKKNMPDIMEAIFDAGYLIFDLIAGILFFVFSKGNPLFILYGVLTLTLCGGDAFHRRFYGQEQSRRCGALCDRPYQPEGSRSIAWKYLGDRPVQSKGRGLLVSGGSLRADSDPDEVFRHGVGGCHGKAVPDLHMVCAGQGRTRCRV